MAGISASADGLWMNQIASNPTDAEDGLRKGGRYLIHDLDTLFTAEFLSALGEAGVESVRLPPRSPNLNSYAERFVRTIKESCLERLVLFGEKALRKAVREFMTHYHSERNQQGIGNLLILSDRLDTNRRGPVRCRQRLGGMLNYYERAA